ncbi:uncharacterized protein N0V89_006356 [Didymosphaeria variabile]|uniref:ubiquitinyl hydrolase 1 n=1 Tax=Didymosphaeria variabile TaxID=1932322 RepID=A0A9W8XN62_9PLEO|nr:uncharacterized protein N0V89_006356 [Didymosphaeria variabile]KAJ4354619.1 hypothetical protein N0V89_006356 [Didymosphaeria variabile]
MATIEYCLRHMVLPPKLPQEDDVTTASEQSLLQVTVAALQDLRNTLSTTEPVHAQKFDPVITIVENLLHSRNDEGYIAETELIKSLHKLAATNSPETLPLHVKAQNAGILVRRLGDDVVFEVFELSPQDEQVTTTKGRLVRSFPSYACRIHLKAFIEEGLVEALAHHIAKLSYHEVSEFRFGIAKEKDNTGPPNTAHPGLVTEYLVSVLAALGKSANVITITKSTREEVIYSSTGSPWRRSPLWLLVRVAMQLEFFRSSGSGTIALGLYKAAILNVLARVLKEAEHEGLDPDLLYVTSAKLSRRLRKLKFLWQDDEDLYHVCANPVRTNLIEVHQKMAALWNAIMDSSDFHVDIDDFPKVLQTLQPANDVTMSFKSLELFLRHISSRKSKSDASEFQPSLELADFDDVGLEFAFDATSEYRYFQLFMVELWVEKHLPSWLETHKTKKTCERLARLVQEYHRAAYNVYSESKSPSGLSVMHITIAELWKACDMCACAIYPLLLSYSPEVDLTPLQSLSLPLRSQMKRLQELERYVEAREKGVDASLPSMFRHFGHEQSFAVKFFDKSTSLQELRVRIDKEAKTRKEKKLDEYERKKKKHEDIMIDVHKMNCENHDEGPVDRGHGRKRKMEDNFENCEKCQLRLEAGKIKISIHESPLSSREPLAKATVFELAKPEPLRFWMDLTFFFMKNVLLFTYDIDVPATAPYSLDSYVGIPATFRKISQDQRVKICSSRQSAHGKQRHIRPNVAYLTPEDVCVQNELDYRYYEMSDKDADQDADGDKDSDQDPDKNTKKVRVKKFLMKKLRMTDEVQKKCTYQVPRRSSQLQQYLTLTSPPVKPNSVAASVSKCPLHLTFDEYKALSLLPVGHKIQYVNILTQLRSPTLDFAKAEAHCILQQTLHIAGPPEAARAIGREIHCILHDDTFAQALMKELDATLRRTQSNWESWRVLAVCILLARRVLTFTESLDIRSWCLDYLTQSREVGLGWIDGLEQRLRTTIDDRRQVDLLSRQTDIALLCISTFDVDEICLNDTLRPPGAFTDIIRLSLIVRKNKDTVRTNNHTVCTKEDAVISNYEDLHLTALQSWRSILFRTSPLLRAGIASGKYQTDMNTAIGFVPSAAWKILPEPKHHWAHTRSGSADVYFNFLTADLIMDGLPLARLPSQYTEQETYQTLFKGMPIEVVPTSEPGMSFSSKDSKEEFSGYQLSFGMEENGRDMLVVASRDDEEFDLVPRSVFEGILPQAFVDEYVHWYNRKTDKIEFRPLETPWTSCEHSWQLTGSGFDWQLENSTSVLVNPKSETGTVVSKILAPLEHKMHIHTWVDVMSSRVSIGLNRSQLDFYFHPHGSKIHSCQYPGMVIDPDQRIGTLVGLVSKLVLQKECEPNHRTILIPEGTVSYCRKRDHNQVSIEVSPNSKITTKIHEYHFDPILARLQDNGTLQSKLLLCYLHALTSHCIVDRATGFTGTEAALLILRSAAVSSFGIFEPEHIELLESIAKLTPSRKPTPTSTRAMQQLHWDEQLSFLSQHSDFRVQVEYLLCQSQQYSLFHPHEDDAKLPKLNLVDQDLLERGQIRSAMFLVDGFGAEKYTRNYDRIYAGRDVHLDPDRSQRAAIITTMVLRKQVALVRKIESLQLSLHTKHLKNASVQGYVPLEPTSLNFVAEWLEEPSSYLPRLWCSLHSALSDTSGPFNKFVVAIFLSTVAFAKGADMDVVQTLAAFYKEPKMMSITIPQISEINLSKGHGPKVSDIERIVHGNRRPFEQCPEYDLPQQPEESVLAWRARRNKQFSKTQQDAINSFSLDSWPDAGTYINIKAAMTELRVQCKIWFENRLFCDYTQRITNAVESMDVAGLPTLCIQSIIPSSKTVESDSSWSFSIRDIFALKPPSPARNSCKYVTFIHRVKANRKIARAQTTLSWPKPPKLSIPTVNTKRSGSLPDDGLSQLCDSLDEAAKSEPERQYVTDLRDSRDALEAGQEQVEIVMSELNNDLGTILQKHHDDCKHHLQEVQSVLENVVKTSDDVGWFIGHRPRVPPTFWVGQLKKDCHDKLSRDWKRAIIDTGLAVTELHRARRLVQVFLQDPTELARELFQKGHTNWSPAKFPETLLMEIEGGFMVRTVQEDIAKQMRECLQGQNSVLQLNCGEGKSSVILPMVAAAMADKKSNLVRVIVGKPQSKQMAHMLRSKLGGLLNRRIAYMPFTRALKLTASNVNDITKIYSDCMQEGGILVVQSEHILSLRLMCIESLVSGHSDLSLPLLELQEFFDGTSRDIVDESDEQFSVKFEVCYTMGKQHPIELSPERWRFAQSMLSMIKSLAPRIRKKLGDSLELLEMGKGRFPRVRLLKADAEDMLLDLLAQNVCRTQRPPLSIARLPPTLREAVYHYIRDAEPSAERVKMVEESDFFSESVRGPLLLIRGLIAGGIVRFALGSKRWRVNYGIDLHQPPRTKLAIPYQSKDNPSQHSEFSHPDVVIILTTLSYYYGGLDEEDLFNAFAHLLRSDQSEEEYANWVSNQDELPERFHNLNDINIEDRHQCETEIFPYLRYSKAAIDYYLGHIVFPKEARQFSRKLSASGWDTAAVKTNPTTGFSGTNDARDLLPLTVQQLDLEPQKHTNAMVLLQHILEPDGSQPQNSVQLVPRKDTTTSDHSDGETLLTLVNSMSEPVRVLLDVGAQILDLSNQQVARTWLAMSHVDTVKAAVFFGNDEELLVVDRRGRVETLQTSPHLKRLDECHVFFDEAHTRGIDMCLPKHYRAAVTLGANLTKDRLVQACLRMRKLGKGQSVVFLIPEEIRTKILDCTSKSVDDEITISDVLAWTIKETWGDLSRSIPLWASQGRRFETHKHLLRGTVTTREHAEQFLEEEAQTLEQRYRPRSITTDLGSLGWDMTNENVREILVRCNAYGTMSLNPATLEEEQERELAPEIEEERQVDRPAPMCTQEHTPDKDLATLVESGTFVTGSRTFMPAFRALADTSAAKIIDLGQFPTDLMVTQGYIRTVKPPPGLSSASLVSDYYHLPVQYILSVVKLRSSSRSQNLANLRKVNALVIISAFEADDLFDRIRNSVHVTLHTYAPRINRTYQPLDSLDLYTIGRPFNPELPRSLIAQLNLFAGQLYFRSYDEYVEMCGFLGLASTATAEGQAVQTDGFILPPVGAWKFRESPVRFLKDLIVKVRREGEAIDKTHLGRMLEGEVLERSDFE